jgi:hypothetical protein
MMKHHGPSDSNASDIPKSDKENQSKYSMASTSVGMRMGMGTMSSKRKHCGTICWSKSDARFNNMMDYTQDQVQERVKFETAVLEEQCQACQQHERFTTCMLAVMQQGLIRPA